MDAECKIYIVHAILKKCPSRILPFFALNLFDFHPRWHVVQFKNIYEYLILTFVFDSKYSRHIFIEKMLAK